MKSLFIAAVAAALLATTASAQAPSVQPGFLAETSFEKMEFSSQKKQRSVQRRQDPYRSMLMGGAVGGLVGGLVKHSWAGFGVGALIGAGSLLLIDHTYRQ